MQITNKQLKRLILEETKRALKELETIPDAEDNDGDGEEDDDGGVFKGVGACDDESDSNLEARVATLEKSASAAIRVMTKLHKNQQTLKDLYKGLKS
jgi:chaperonin cofactor prefoldin